MPRLKKFSKHISLVLLVLFSITLLPFNFLHQHAEDEHGMAMHRHEKKEQHHCELDDQFCQPFASDCQHDQHLSRTLAKCFSCEFHFIKHFIPVYSDVAFSTPVVQSLHKSFRPGKLHAALVRISNKGPPAGPVI